MPILTRPSLSGIHLFQRIIISLVLLSLLAAASGSPVQLAAQSGDPTRCVRYYVVAQGERLSQVGARYGMSAQFLAEANSLSTSNPLPHGYVLCIPYKPLDWYYPQATLNATASFNHLSVWGSGFPAEHRFNIRVKGYLGSKTKRVGSVLVDEDGNFQAFPRIPKEFQKARTLEICLKDNDLSYRMCTRVSR